MFFDNVEIFIVVNFPPKESIFKNVWVKKSKDWYIHLVAHVILRYLVFLIAFSFNNASSIDPRSLANFGPKFACSGVKKSAVSKKSPDFKKQFTDDVKMLYEKACKFHVDNAVRFDLVLANIRESGH